MTSAVYGRQVNMLVCSVVGRFGKSMANGNFHVEYAIGVWEADIFVAC